VAGGTLTGAAWVFVASLAFASNPLEYPDNGTASFSRGGAWLAVGNEPIAAHYNPAALATQGSGFSIEQQLNFDHVCYDRRGPGNVAVGPNDQVPVAGTTTHLLDYLPVCNTRGAFPSTIPSMSVAWRASDRLGFGLAIVPPATYGTPKGAFPIQTLGINNLTHQTEFVPAPYRYMQTDNQSTIIFPTASVGWEMLKHFRVGAGFISGIAVIDIDTVGGSNNGSNDALGDHANDDTSTHLLTKDLFVPGVVLSAHWSVLPELDVSFWGRWMDSVRTTTADITVTAQLFDPTTKLQPTCTGDITSCQTATVNRFPGNALTAFKYTIPPEFRIGARFHQPRTKSRLLWEKGGEVRDPLHDDSFDVEVDGSYSLNSVADNIEVRFHPLIVRPTDVDLPPNADRATGYKDSYGVRVGGQWNAVQDKLALRAGGWFESESVDPAYMSIFPVGATRWGFGGGVVLRQDFIDISLGYQRHLSAGQNNYGVGLQTIPVGTGSDNYRSVHTVNGGHITESANVFSLGGTVRFY